MLRYEVKVMSISPSACRACPIRAFRGGVGAEADCE